MGKVEGIIKSEIVRLAKREIRKITSPLGRDVRLLKSMVSKLRKAVTSLERFTAYQQKELRKGKIPLEATSEEVKASRFSPRLIQSLRKRLGVTQKEMATLAGVTVGAIYQWESGKFEPRDEKKGVFVALRKLGRRDVRKILEERGTEKAEKKAPRRRGKGRKKSVKK